jgi:hypothetical protein
MFLQLMYIQKYKKYLNVKIGCAYRAIGNNELVLVNLN